MYFENLYFYAVFLRDFPTAVNFKTKVLIELKAYEKNKDS